ncbi:hypothetical protein QQ045_001283 [Rhodiola kirilowii]
MASSSPCAVQAALNFEPYFRKLSHFHPLSKDINKSGRQVSYQRNQKPVNGNMLKHRYMEFGEPLAPEGGTPEFESSVHLPLLLECISLKSVSGTKSVHGYIIKSGVQEDLYVMTSLVNAYAKCGTMDQAAKVFDNLTRKNEITWTTLMTGYVHNSEPEHAIQVFIDMLEAGVYPTNFTLGIVVSACTLLGYVGVGKQIHAYSVKYMICFDTSFGNSLCNFYSKCGNLDFAIKVFRGIGEKNVISWTSAVSACNDNRAADMGLRMFVEMLGEGVKPSEYTLTCVLAMCYTLGVLYLGPQVHCLVKKLGFESDFTIKSSIMYLYLKGRLVEEAQKLFEEIEITSIGTWNAFITGHSDIMELAENNVLVYQSGVKALQVFKRMKRTGLKPDVLTLSNILTVCATMAASEQGEQIHAEAVKSGNLADVFVGTSVLTMYEKCGSIEKATKAFAEVSSRTVITWTCMIMGFAQNGQGKQALQLFEEMKLAGVRPSRITFIAILTACAQGGFVDEGFAYFEMMKTEYNMTPMVAHHSCMVEMLVRLARLEEAFDYVGKMECQPNEHIWSILVSGCKKFEQLLKLDSNASDIYVKLLKRYESPSRTNDPMNLFKTTKNRSLCELDDWSWVSTKDRIYAFTSCSQLRGQSTDSCRLLEDLLSRAKRMGLGFESQSHLQDISKDENAFQSEIFAAAFALVNTHKAEAIRVIKSSTIYLNSHAFLKMISLLTKREIIVRDNKRLHKFVDGHCSCGDISTLL